MNSYTIAFVDSSFLNIDADAHYLDEYWARFFNRTGIKEKAVLYVANREIRYIKIEQAE